VVLRVVFEETPRVADAERSDARLVGEGIWWVTTRFGFVEIPDVCAALEQVSQIDEAIDFSQAVYFATRDLITPAKGMSWLARRRLPLFAFLYRNAAKVVDRFRLPAENVVEIARQIEI
jgi:KUP system potassium uptake protein